MNITDFLNHLALEATHRRLLARLGHSIEYGCSDIEILASAIEVSHV